MPRLTIQEEDKSQEFDPDAKMLDCINAMDVKIGQVCGGDGACGTCRVEITDGWDNLTPQTPDETYKEMEPPYRLSCQAHLTGDVVMKVAKVD